MSVYADDSILVEALKTGEISAFEHIYTAYFDALLNYADRLVHDIETAKDVVQQVYLKVWDNRKKLEINLSVKAYLFKSVYNYSINTLVHQKNVQKYEQQQLQDLYFSTIIQTPEAEIKLREEDLEKTLQQAINKLPEKCREVFLLSKMEGLKNREIAKKLNISENTVERHITIAISKLQKKARINC